MSIYKTKGVKMKKINDETLKAFFALNEATADSNLQGRMSPQREFLTAVNEAIIGARKQGLSYKQIKANIYKAFSFRISEQTIRQFVKNSGVVDVDKKKSTETKPTKENKAPVTQKTVDSDSNERINADFNDI
jgi:hypothetical protein